MIASQANPIPHAAKAHETPDRGTTRAVTRTAVAPTFCVDGSAAPLITPSANPDDHPATWTNRRILTCDGETVETYLTPGSFGTPFTVVGSDEEIIPKHVEVGFPDGTGPLITLHVNGFDVNGHDAVRCDYTDPGGLHVDLLGLRA